jgi:plasmid stability protein
MLIEVPDELATALKTQAHAHGVSPAGYVRVILERDLAQSLQTQSIGPQSAGIPFKTGRGILAKYGPAPSAQEIEANQAEIFRNFGEHV